MNTPTPTIASTALKELLEPRSAKAALAWELKEGAYQISRWLAGDGKPIPPQRARIEDLLGLSWRLWDVEQFKEPEVAAALDACGVAQPNAVALLIARYLEECERAKTGTDEG